MISMQYRVLKQTPSADRVIYAGEMSVGSGSKFNVSIMQFSSGGHSLSNGRGVIEDINSEDKTITFAIQNCGIFVIPSGQLFVELTKRYKYNYPLIKTGTSVTLRVVYQPGMQTPVLEFDIPV